MRALGNPEPKKHLERSENLLDIASHADSHVCRVRNQWPSIRELPLTDVAARARSRCCREAYERGELVESEQGYWPGEVMR